MADRAKRLQSAVLLFALILLIFLITSIALSFLPQDLSDLEGRAAEGEEVAPPRNIQRVLENAAQQDLVVTLTEKELNHYLSSQLSGEQDGFLKNQVSYQGAWVRLREGIFELIIEREAFNRPHTIAMNVEIEQLIEEGDKMNTKIDWRGGRLGQLPVPQGYLLLVMPGYEELARVLKPEVRALRTLLEGKSVIEISEGKVTFTPRSTGSGSLPVF